MVEIPVDRSGDGAGASGDTLGVHRPRPPNGRRAQSADRSRSQVFRHRQT